MNEQTYTAEDIKRYEDAMIRMKEQNTALKQWAECLEFRCMQYTHGTLCDQCDHKNTCQAQ